MRSLGVDILINGIDGAGRAGSFEADAANVFAGVAGDAGNFRLPASVDEHGAGDGDGEVGAPVVRDRLGAPVRLGCAGHRVVGHEGEYRTTLVGHIRVTTFRATTVTLMSPHGGDRIGRVKAATRIAAQRFHLPTIPPVPQKGGEPCLPHQEPPRGLAHGQS